VYVYRCDQCGDITPTVVLYAHHTGHPPSCRHAKGDFPMQRVADGEAIPMPLEANDRATLVPFKVQHLHKAGILLPETQHALDWMFRHRATNGMAEAFCMVAGRRCIDLVAFARLVREKRA
jgi:hypothetical protein